MSEVPTCGDQEPTAITCLCQSCHVGAVGSDRLCCPAAEISLSSWSSLFFFYIWSSSCIPFFCCLQEGFGTTRKMKAPTARVLVCQGTMNRLGCKLLNWNLTPASRARLEAMRSIWTQMLAGSIVGSGICLLLAVVTEGLFSAQGVCLPPRQTCGGTTDGLANSHLGCGVQGSVLVCTKGGKQNNLLRPEQQQACSTVPGCA